MNNIVTDVLATLAYGVVGILLMGIGFVLVDVVTPGRLRELIWTDRNRNAALLLASNLLSVGIIVVTAIVLSDDDFVTGIVGCAIYGLLGLAIMTGSFWLLDIVTPGRLGVILVDPQPHPAVWVSATVHLATGGIIAAAIS